MQGVSVQQLAERMKFKCFTPCVDMSKRMIVSSEINRPALELAGYFEHFAEERIQIIGMVEYSYLESLEDEVRTERYRKLLGFNVPCVIMCRDYEPDEEVLRIAGERGIPILGSPDATSNVAAEAIYFLTGKLAPCISIHGVLVDVYGEGILITGESGIGKSEAALEQAFIKMLEEQGYAYLPIHDNADLVANLRRQLELLNNYTFTDKEWDFFFKDKIANANDGIKEKTRRIQEDNIQNLTREDGSTVNITLLDKTSTTTVCRSLTSMWRTAATMITAMMSRFW